MLRSELHVTGTDSKQNIDSLDQFYFNWFENSEFLVPSSKMEPLLV